MTYDLQTCIDELLDCNAFELQFHTDEQGQTNCYLPYMMNDALEYYFTLKDCRMTGEYKAGAVTGAELVNDASSHALILRQKDGEFSTLWFQDVVKELNCYRYHEIGHFWVKGQEQWRQLVYIIGTIYDKFSYLGEGFCNEQELELLPLMEFAPFRYWSPIHESLDDHYPDTLDGFAYFKELCTLAGDNHLLKLARRYETVACGNFWITDFYRKLALPKLVKQIAHELTQSGHEALYELIYQKVCEASLQYPERDYGTAMNSKVCKSRDEMRDALLSKGFVGEYPRFSKDNVSVFVTEEHPFTLSALEYDNYEFRIQLMVSKSDEKMKYLNQGFFENAGKNNSGEIIKSIDKISHV